MAVAPSARPVGALLCASLPAVAGRFTAHGRRVVLHGINRPGGEYDRLPGLGLERRLDLLVRAQLDQRLQWHPHRLRCRGTVHTSAR